MNAKGGYERYEILATPMNSNKLTKFDMKKLNF